MEDSKAHSLFGDLWCTVFFINPNGSVAHLPAWVLEFPICLPFHPSAISRPILPIDTFPSFLSIFLTFHLLLPLINPSSVSNLSLYLMLMTLRLTVLVWSNMVLVNSRKESPLQVFNSLCQSSCQPTHCKSPLHFISQ